MQRERSREAGRMTERKRGQGGGEQVRALEKGKTLLWSSRGGRRKRERDGEQGRETERENKRWGAGQSTRKRKIRQGRRPRSSERKKGRKETPER